MAVSYRRHHLHGGLFWLLTSCEGGYFSWPQMDTALGHWWILYLGHGHREALGRKESPDSLVFERVDGRPLWPDNFTRRFKELVEKAGLPPAGVHSMRHGHASLLLKELPITTVSRRLGHKNVRVTLEIYAHALPEAQEEAARLINLHMARARETEESQPEAPAGAQEE